MTRGGYPGEAGGNVTRLTCSSSGAARQECAVSGASRVRLVRQISSSPCTLNQSYGIGVGHIWVSNGCRGEFDVTVGGPGDGTGLPGLPGTAERVTCESQGGERTECRIRTGAAVQLVRQLSTSPCARNSTWGAGYGVDLGDPGLPGGIRGTLAYPGAAGADASESFTYRTPFHRRLTPLEHPDG